MSSHIQWLRKKLEVAEAERSRLDDIVRAISVTLEFAEQQEVPEPQITQPPPPPAKELRNEMWKILKAEGSPLHYREIFRRLRANNAEVPGRDPAKNVGAHLSNDERFESLGSGEWGLASWTNDKKGTNRGDQSADYDEVINRDVVIPISFDEDPPEPDFDDFDEVPF